MSETNEAEVLFEVYETARTKTLDEGIGKVPTAELVVNADRTGVLAVAAKAREMDAARGGTLSGAEMMGIKEYCSQHGPTHPAVLLLEHASEQGRRNAAQAAAADAARELLEAADGHADRAQTQAWIAEALRLLETADTANAAAQGRTIAALTTERDEARRDAVTERERAAERALRRLGWTYTDGAEEWRPPLGPSAAPLLDAIAEKDARIAELEAKLDGVEASHDDEDAAHAETLERMVRAESALATLRQELEEERKRVEAWHETMADLAMLADPNSMVGDYATVRDVLLRRKDGRDPGYGVRHDATPTEHPDTATLRAIRERANDVDGLCEAYAAATGRVFAQASSVPALAAVSRWILTGDSGPNGGGGGEDAAEVATCAHGVPTAFWCMSCRLATTPPDVAASEAMAVRLVPGQCLGEACEKDARTVGQHRVDCPHGTQVLVPASEATPTHEEDWRTVEGFAVHSDECGGDSFGPCTCGADRVVAALARLRDEPRRAAEDMRKRCENAVFGTVKESRERIAAMSLEVVP